MILGVKWTDLLTVLAAIVGIPFCHIIKSTK